MALRPKVHILGVGATGLDPINETQSEGLNPI